MNPKKSFVCLDEKVDVIEFIYKNSRDSSIQNPDGTWRKPRFGDYHLEVAFENLNAYPQPWSFQKLVEWFKAAENEELRVNLLRVLAATRDPRAALILGDLIEDSSLNIRLAAVYGIQDYFIDVITGGGTEQHFITSQKWFKENKGSLEKL